DSVPYTLAVAWPGARRCAEALRAPRRHRRAARNAARRGEDHSAPDGRIAAMAAGSRPAPRHANDTRAPMAAGRFDVFVSALRREGFAVGVKAGVVALAAHGHGA